MNPYGISWGLLQSSTDWHMLAGTGNFKGKQPIFYHQNLKCINLNTPPVQIVCPLVPLYFTPISTVCHFVQTTS